MTSLNKDATIEIREDHFGFIVVEMAYNQDIGLDASKFIIEDTKVGIIADLTMEYIREIGEKSLEELKAMRMEKLQAQKSKI